MHENETKPGGPVSDNRSDRPAELSLYDLLALTAVPGMMRKPILPPPFAADAEKLKEMCHDILNGKEDRCTDEELHQAGQKLLLQVEAFFARQARFPFTYGQKLDDVIGLADFDEDGLLKPAVYHVDWATFAARFGTTPRRRKQLAALLAALHLGKKAGCRRVSVGGSFITAKVAPNDVDLRWEEGLDRSLLEPMLVERAHTAPKNSRWPQMRRSYFGLDCGFSAGGLEYRSVVDVALNLPACLSGCGTVRSVGVISLDLTVDLPENPDFMPFSLWTDHSGLVLDVADLVQLRRRLPEHWSGVSDESLAARGVDLVAEPI
jgi:hypothetical protein